MITKIGSQNREPLKDTEYKIDTWIGADHNEVILNDAGKLELWFKNDHFAGYVIEIDGFGYEFVRSISKADARQLLGLD